MVFLINTHISSPYTHYFSLFLEDFTLPGSCSCFCFWTLVFTDMGGENSKKTKNSDHYVSRMLGWISSKVNGVTRHHLEGAAATIIFACLFVFVSKNKSMEHWQSKGHSHRTLRRSQSLGALHGGRVAIQRILDAQHASVNPKVLDEAEEELNALLDKDHSDQINFSELQSVVAKLEMSGKEVQ
ncbi:uncharacterized protein LOC131238715 isoform X1 [Magnolia sinica]|uniref:uncharacterized protein LOC131238715 isoform X1 n=1 Tax=Magnolia sinica TaxID=86752 RepID=UPI00265A28C9|nr:uncharacterized protein LOC131238715 isoform X1 [Magnolia sinica]